MILFSPKLNRLIALLCLLVIAALSGCESKKAGNLALDATSVLHENQDQLTQIIIYDVFSPPVAARIYSYTSLASYEAMRYSRKGTASLAEKMYGFGKMPVPLENKKYDFALAASRAFFTVAHKVVFSLDSLKNYENNLFNSFKAQ